MSSSDGSSSSGAEKSAEDLQLAQKNGKRKYENMKRKDYISWKDYFMGIAFLAAQRSKDPRTQVGACIVSDDNKIVGVGYNSMPRGLDDDFPWFRDKSSFLNDKLTYVCHAEMNAFANAHPKDTKGCKLYVTLFPCNECAKIIIQAGIKKVFYSADKMKEKNTAAKIMFDKVDIKYRHFKPKITLKLKASDSRCTPSPPKKERRDDPKTERQ